MALMPSTHPQKANKKGVPYALLYSTSDRYQFEL